MRAMACSLAMWVGLVGGASKAGVIVAPLAQAGAEGNTASGVPFRIAPVATMRYQQVFAASQFASFSGPQSISQIAFRPDARAGGTFMAAYSDLEINLSTTRAEIDFTLSTTFANNVGADDTRVFDGALTLSSAFTGPVGGPKDFDIIINLITPFLYDPSAGNLLMDIRNVSGGSNLATNLDAVANSSVVSSVRTDPNFGSQTVYSPGAFQTNRGSGLVTRFTFGPSINAVPEPSTLVSAGIAGVLGLGYALRRRAAGG